MQLDLHRRNDHHCGALLDGGREAVRGKNIQGDSIQIVTRRVKESHIVGPSCLVHQELQLHLALGFVLASLLLQLDHGRSKQLGRGDSRLNEVDFVALNLRRLRRICRC
jgi:hypothetical protein